MNFVNRTLMKKDENLKWLNVEIKLKILFLNTKTAHFGSRKISDLFFNSLRSLV